MIWSLQTLRFVAAAMIVFVHAAQTAVGVTGSVGFIPHDYAGLGLSGVDIFFVLSGVIITRVAVGRSPGDFLWARFRRVVPFYWLCSIPAIVTSVAVGEFGWRTALATVFLWPATDQMASPALEVGWTLCFEMVFYLAATLVLVDRRLLYVLLATYAIAFANRAAGPVPGFLGNPIIMEFLFGVMIARLPPWRNGAWALPAGVLALAAVGYTGMTLTGDTLEFLDGRDGLQRVVVYGLPSALIVYGALQIRARQSLWTYLGDASYSIYLTHTFAVTSLLALWTFVPAPAAVIILVAMAASILLAWRIFERIEKPVIGMLPKRVVSKRKPEASGQS